MTNPVSKRVPLQTSTRRDGTVTDAPCPICSEHRKSYLFVVRGLPICRCTGCGLVALNPKPSVQDYASFYGNDPNASVNRFRAMDTATEREAVQRYLQALEDRGLTSGRVLAIAPTGHPLPGQLAEKGFQVVSRSALPQAPDPDLDSTNGPSFDAVILLHQIQESDEPVRMMQDIRNLLRPEGVLLLTTPSFDSWPRSFFGSRWTDWKPENRYYFTPRSVQAMLLKSGFEQVWIDPDRRLYTLQHIHERAQSSPRTLLTGAISLFHKLTPGFLRQARIRFSSSGMIVTAVPGQRRERPLCSVIVPAFNEKNTVAELLDALLAKQIPGSDKEVIIVESNSTDGTRDIVKKYADHPEVRLFFQDQPRGKGNAVRHGLEHARGDVVLIQDADLEYDLNDYDDLVEPLLRYRSAFILGARHGGRLKMREFEDNQSLSLFLNFGHVLFTTLVNWVYWQRLRDPFTMFKVFWRDCAYGLKFECNRFDFDYELLIKLLRKGYQPIEIPVNYRSRSFKEGKKVRMFRDPLTWIVATFKYRVVSPGRPKPKREAQKSLSS